MNENKIKHLEFIQSIMNRLSGNSFLLKGWSVTLVCALFALAADKANIKFAIVAYFPVIVFWGLDSFFLSNEKQYRELYKEVSAKAEKDIDFNLDASKFDTDERMWYRCLFTKTILPFHGSLLVVVCITMFMIPRMP
jgi:hypothetical protein